jgi:enoyl-CoA hydratase
MADCDARRKDSMIDREEREGVVTLRLAHGKANALDIELCDAITAALRDAVAARAVIVTGTRSIFSAGVDLFRLTNEGAPYVERFFPALVEALTALFVFPRPLIAAINGHAIAGGCLIAATADYRVMSGGTIGVPELSVGVPLPSIAIEVLRFATGTHAHRLATSGEVIAAQDAKSRGLLDAVVDADQLMSSANEAAERLATIPAEAFRLTKAHLRGPFLRDAKAREAEDREAINAWADPRTHEHIKAYLQRTIRK